MSRFHVIENVVVATTCCLISPGAQAEDCYNAAYRYCCDLIPEFKTPCDVSGGYCYGSVYAGHNDFHTVQVPGAYTDNSFDVDPVEFRCDFYAPICHPLDDPAWCDTAYEITNRNCISLKLKTQYTRCEDQ